MNGSDYHHVDPTMECHDFEIACMGQRIWTLTNGAKYLWGPALFHSEIIDYNDLW